MVSFDDVRSTKPAQMHGDLHITAEGFYFLAFRKISAWAVALQVNLGLVGVWLAYRSEKKLRVEMQQWRQGHGGRYLDELVKELGGSWLVSQDQIRIIKPRFVSPGVVIEQTDGSKYSVETNKKQSRAIQDFARQRNWQVK